MYVHVHMYEYVCWILFLFAIFNLPAPIYTYECNRSAVETDLRRRYYRENLKRLIHLGYLCSRVWDVWTILHHDERETRHLIGGLKEISSTLSGGETCEDGMQILRCSQTQRFGSDYAGAS